MKRLSLSKTMEDSRQAALRFPAVLICAVAAAVACIIMTELESRAEEVWTRVLMASVLGIPLTLSLAFWSENYSRGSWFQWGGVLVSFLFWVVLPETINQAVTIRYFILLACLHFALPIAPFSRRCPELAIWQFNKELILRLLSSLIFTIVLFAGLSLALVALDTLLGVDLDGDIYFELFFILVFVFHTWFFLGGLPVEPRRVASELDFPRPLRIFAQHILSTLVVVYLAILLAYLIKILVTGVWPSGWIGWLVSGVAVAGYLSLVLLYPLRLEKGQSWVKAYFLIFHILMIPAGVMLAMAITKRISQYGVTELRYMLVFLGAWLLVMLVVSLIRRRMSLRWIPLSLAFLFFLAGIGPQSAVDVALDSQMGRLLDQLDGAGMMQDGFVRPLSQELDNDPLQELRSSFRHLIKNNGSGVLQEFFSPADWDSLNLMQSDESLPMQGTWYQSEQILKKLKLHLPGPGHPEIHHFERNRNLEHSLGLNGYDELVKIHVSQGQTTQFIWNETTGNLTLNPDTLELVLTRDDQQLWALPLRDALAPILQAPSVESLPDLENWDFEVQASGWKVRLLINRIYFTTKDQEPDINFMDAWLMLKEPQN